MVGQDLLTRSCLWLLPKCYQNLACNKEGLSSSCHCSLYRNECECDIRGQTSSRCCNRDQGVHSSTHYEKSLRMIPGDGESDHNRPNSATCRLRSLHTWDGQQMVVSLSDSPRHWPPPRTTLYVNSYLF